MTVTVIERLTSVSSLQKWSLIFPYTKSYTNSFTSLNLLVYTLQAITSWTIVIILHDFIHILVVFH